MDSTTIDRLAHAGAYLRQGWAIVPLHWIEGGRCSCGRGSEHDAKQGGKHPIDQGWTRTPVIDPAGAVAAWTRYPLANIGIATGRRSGIWVLDVDPDNGGDRRLAELVEQHGPLPETYQVRTGSQGTHHYWSMPPDFEPTNSRGRLPAGLDVRGTGGQVVAPPSVSGKGGYAPLTALQVAPAPGWLLDLVRPPVYEPRPSPAEWTTGDTERGGRYARAAVERLAGDLASAAEGMRNDTAFRVACRLHELLNAPWSGLTEQYTYGAYVGGAERASLNAGTPFPEREAYEVWVKAGRKVGGTAAELPVNNLDGAFFPWGVLSPEPPPFDDANRMRTDANPGSQDDPVATLVAGMLTPGQVLEMANPRPLVLGVLDLDSSAWLIGKPGSAKSFVALGLAGAVGSGQPWMGRPVQRGPVVVAVGEGLSDLKLRIQAWQSVYGPMTDVWFLPRPVLADERRGPGEWSLFVEACRRLGAVLVIIDTQARASVGLRENDNSEMMIYVQQVQRIQRATGACVLTVHHIGRTGTDARGASALDGAQDTELRAERVSVDRLTLWTEKQKAQTDGGAGIGLALLKVPGGLDPETGRDLSSLVVVDAAGAPRAQVIQDWIDNAAERQGQIVGVVADHFPGIGGTKPEIAAVLRERFGAIPKGSYARAWDQLVKAEILIRVDGTQRYLLASLAP